MISCNTEANKQCLLATLRENDELFKSKGQVSILVFSDFNSMFYLPPNVLWAESHTFLLYKDYNFWSMNFLCLNMR